MLCECLHSFPELDPVLEEERRDSLLPTSVFIPPREGLKRDLSEEETEEEKEAMEEEKEEKEEKKEGVAENKEDM